MRTKAEIQAEIDRLTAEYAEASDETIEAIRDENAVAAELSEVVEEAVEEAAEEVVEEAVEAVEEATPMTETVTESEVAERAVQILAERYGLTSPDAQTVVEETVTVTEVADTNPEPSHWSRRRII